MTDESKTERPLFSLIKKACENNTSPKNILSLLLDIENKIICYRHAISEREYELLDALILHDKTKSFRATVVSSIDRPICFLSLEEIRQLQDIVYGIYEL